jgi:hypothetical protein
MRRLADPQTGLNCCARRAPWYPAIWHTFCYTAQTNDTKLCREVTTMTEQASAPQLPSADEILAANERLFGTERKNVHRFKTSGVHYIDLPGGLILVEQNPQKDSHWAEQARAGHQVAWVMRDGTYLARVVDRQVEFL